MKRVLLTAFEPFGGASINSSLEVAKVVMEHPFEDTEVDMLELPVSRFEAINLAVDRIRESKPDAVVMLGVAAGRARITPERVAINMDDFDIPDNAGDQPRNELIVKGGPVGYFSTLPIDAIVTDLNNANIPAEISNTAGLFLCNRLFYHVMHHLSRAQLEIPAGFIHLPQLPEQLGNSDSKQASMQLEKLTEATRRIIELCSS